VNISYPNPFAEHTARKSQAWYDIFRAYVSYESDVSTINSTVPLSKLKNNPNDGARWRWNTPLFETEVNNLVSGIRLSGEFEAILVRENEDGTYLILDGHHRVAAWEKLGQSDIPAIVVIVKPFVSKF
jgi:hypothetical protein